MKLKIYLDTNIIYGYFKHLAERKKTTPFIITFIETNTDKLQAITSFFTLAEVVESLLKRGLNRNMVLRFLRIFRRRCKIKMIEKTIITGETLKWTLRGVSVKDAIQLCIAKNLDAVFLTQDRRLIKIGRNFYQKILSFQELFSLLRF